MAIAVMDEVIDFNEAANIKTGVKEGVRGKIMTVMEGGDLKITSQSFDWIKKPNPHLEKNSGAAVIIYDFSYLSSFKISVKVFFYIDGNTYKIEAKNTEGEILSKKLTGNAGINDSISEIILKVVISELNVVGQLATSNMRRIRKKLIPDRY